MMFTRSPFCYVFPFPFPIQGNPGVVTCMENTIHGLETGDTVTFREVVGMTTINGTAHKVKGECPIVNNWQI